MGGFQPKAFWMAGIEYYDLGFLFKPPIFII